MYLDWAIVVKLVEALAWPLVASIALFQLKPFVTQLFGMLPGAHIRAGPIQLDIPASEAAAKAKEDLGSDEVDAERPAVEPLPADATQDILYDRIMNSWRSLMKVLSEAFNDRTGKYLDLRSVLYSIEQLQKVGILDDETADATRNLFVVRSQAKRRGKGRFTELGLTVEQVVDYAATARTLENRIG